MATVIVPSAWAERGPRKFSIDCGTVGDAVRALADREPALGVRLLNANGSINRFLSIYVNEDRVLQADLDAQTVRAVDVVLVVPPMAGG